MAKVVKEFPKHKRTREEMYPWDAWLDGRIWELEQGEDYNCKSESFRQAAMSAARSRGVKVQTTIDFENETVTIQAYQP